MLLIAGKQTTRFGKKFGKFSITSSFRKKIALCLQKAVILGITAIFPLIALAAEYPIPLDKVHIDPRDKPSLQRGARLFINYCMGCHALNYIRYNRIAKDLGITNDQGGLSEQLVKESFIFTGDKLTDTMRNAMPETAAKQWFGVAPPDLTLVARVRGVDWLYTYLRSFYKDSTRPWGANNLLYPDIAMPDVLVGLQGIQIPVYRNGNIAAALKTSNLSVVDHLVLLAPGTMMPVQFDAAMADLVNFLAYTGEPFKLERKYIGLWALGFLIIFAVLAYLLKKEYWKDIR